MNEYDSVPDVVRGLKKEALKRIRNPQILYSFSSDSVRLENKTDYDLVTVPIKLKSECISYISDIHLDHKIHERCGKKADIRKITEVVSEIADCIGMLQETRMLLIAGDVSFDFDVNEMFYNRLRQISGSRIIVVLGNHELTGTGLTIPENVDRREFIIGSYRSMLSKLNITLLDDNVYCKQLGKPAHILNSDTIMCMGDEQLSELTSDSEYLILGGTGYSGNDPVNNASTGLYGPTITTIDDDRKLSSHFESIYDRLRPFSENCPIIILTHMPEHDWCSGKMQSDFIHVNGHTHANQRIITKDRISYHDNQVGYHDTDICLKYFCLDRYKIPFDNIDDGIYAISTIHYKEIFESISDYLVCNRTLNIHMLKKDGFYMFIDVEEKALNLMNGGNMVGLQNRDLNYYYENMTEYALKVMAGFSEISKKLDSLSKYVRSFGGDGTVHGCIVDIDYFNHLYCNPMDGTVTPYFATSMVDKTVYKDIPSLLCEHAPRLYDRYLEVKGADGKSIIPTGNETITNRTRYHDMDIYRMSWKARSYQHLIKDRIIRSWDDNLLKKKSGKELTSVEYPVIALSENEPQKELETLVDHAIKSTVNLIDGYREPLVDMGIYADLKMKMNGQRYFERINGLMSVIYNTRNIQLDKEIKDKMIKGEIESRHGKRRQY